MTVEAARGSVTSPVLSSSPGGGLSIRTPPPY
jgi:hypothetical protein